MCAKKSSNEVEPEHKSTLLGCTANLITAIVGAGIIGIPYAMKETGLIAGVCFILLSAALGCKSLRLLVETARHVDAPSYEILCELTFGKWGWIMCNINMLMMSWGPMLSYMMIVKDTSGKVLGFDDVAEQKITLVFCGLFIMLPLSLQRDMADLAKTARLCVVLDIFLVLIITKFSPIDQSISDAGGVSQILSKSIFRPRTCFIGLGIISFALSCQHSSLIIAGSLDHPTKERWNLVSLIAMSFCAGLAIVMGIFGYLGFLEQTEGDIFNNFLLPIEVDSSANNTAAKAITFARGVLCSIMFLVYPLESFVARHVIMTNLFQGREAHEGDDHTVLDRWDRRVATTVILFLSVLIPALNFSDLGLVLAVTGTISATFLAYLLPGALYLGVHGQEFLDLTESMWQYNAFPYSFSLTQTFLWYILLMPLWCKISRIGKEGITSHREMKELQAPALNFSLGKVKHTSTAKHGEQDSLLHNLCSMNHDKESKKETISISQDRSDGPSTDHDVLTTGKKYGSTPCFDEAEEDPQHERLSDFVVAIVFILFGITALTSGMISILYSSNVYN